MSDPLELLLRKKLADAKLHHEEAVLSGTLKDFEDYRYQCGIILGLNVAIDVVSDLFNNLRQDND